MGSHAALCTNVVLERVCSVRTWNHLQIVTMRTPALKLQAYAGDGPIFLKRLRPCGSPCGTWSGLVFPLCQCSGLWTIVCHYSNAIYMLLKLNPGSKFAKLRIVRNIQRSLYDFPHPAQEFLEVSQYKLMMCRCLYAMICFQCKRRCLEMSITCLNELMIILESHFYTALDRIDL